MKRETIHTTVTVALAVNPRPVGLPACAGLANQPAAVRETHRGPLRTPRRLVESGESARLLCHVDTGCQLKLLLYRSSCAWTQGGMRRPRASAAEARQQQVERSLSPTDPTHARTGVGVGGGGGGAAAGSGYAALADAVVRGGVVPVVGAQDNATLEATTRAASVGAVGAAASDEAHAWHRPRAQQLNTSALGAQAHVASRVDRRRG